VMDYRTEDSSRSVTDYRLDGGSESMKNAGQGIAGGGRGTPA